ncbi:hypothetical protein [Niveibacterium microcysteis]|uniref:Uncharacterized protein n=1 Tax=Niveibacterium microcysteis TaxID=2811415 RepID=A0ABX7MB93_9RHOO|nr:hypothetical protein [Niveibacterium microcysteis]QSI78659.1 hypothetical protein JY500_08660 [Niveibacterium microcysteis]
MKRATHIHDHETVMPAPTSETVDTGTPARLKMPPRWIRADRHWWLHLDHGGVARERDGTWFGYPLGWSDARRLGPYANALLAAQAVEAAEPEEQTSGHRTKP